MTPEQEQEVRDLKELVSCPGWAVFTSLVNDAHGPEATLQAIERAVGLVAMGNQEAVQDATQHVISASKAARGVVHLPSERIAQLVGQKTVRKPFAAWRRA
jgi:hypothetical protein